jgi:hypothetical protein
MSNCYATGIVRGYNNVGGFAGFNAATKTVNCYAIGTVTGVLFSNTVLSNSGWEIGGFAGENCAPVINCYAIGSAAGSSNVGGFTGYTSSSILNCYSIGSATGDSWIGGVAGYIQSNGTISDCYWDQQASGNASGYGFIDTGGVYSGYGLTTAQMKQSSSFSGWDFTTVWSINSNINNGYPYLASGIATSVKGVTGVTPKTFSLLQNYPNPFNPSTQISYQVPSNSRVSLKVFDLLGREVTALVNEVKSAGTYTATFNADKIPSGVYFYQLSAGNFLQTKKMVMLK